MYLMLARQPKRLRRKGYTLVIFAMLLFALFGLAALVIDLGLVRLTQRQMQTAVDSAALEGLRLNFANGVPEKWVDSDLSDDPKFILNALPHPESAQDPDDLQWKAWYERVRRFAASDIAAEHYRSVFDNAENALAAMENNPEIDSAFTGMIRRAIYSPELKPNYGNSTAGDMLAGNYYTNESHGEGSDEDPYHRADLEINNDPGAFLVRLRRTSESFNDEVGSTGPKLPYFFGHTSILRSQSNFAQKQHYQLGVDIRATTIAANSYKANSNAMNVTPIKAKAIGKARLSDNLVGATPLALLRSTWEAIPLAGPNIDDALAVKIDAFGVLVNPMDVSEKFGHITSSDGTEVGILDGTSNAVFLGHLCAEPNAAQLQTFNPESFAESIRSNAICYVVIIPNAGSPVEDRAIGFGFIEVSILDPAPSPTFLIRKRANQHAYENASAAVVKEIPEFNLIWSEHTSLMTPLLAPALVR